MLGLRTSLFHHALRLHQQHPDSPLPRDGDPYPDDDLHRLRSSRRREEDPRLRGFDAAAILDRHFADDDAPPSRLAEAFEDVEVPILPSEHIAAAALRADRQRVRRTGRWLVRHSTNRSSATMGLALLATDQNKDDIPLVQTIGLLSNWFGPLAAAALERRRGGTEALLWLAQRVAGWGLVHVIEALCRYPDQASREWLLRHACDGDYLNGYFVGRLATTTHLHEAIIAPGPDDELVDHTGRLLAIMADCHGMGMTLEHYPPAPIVLAAHATHLGRQTPAVSRYVEAAAIAFHLANKPPGQCGCTAEQRDHLLARYLAVLNRPEWCEPVRANLGLDERLSSGFMTNVASRLRLHAFPTSGPYPIRNALTTGNTSRMGGGAWVTVRTMNETEVDGVPVLWADAPGPLTGTLVFGVGARDETFRTIGVTHLVEHLAMSTLPRVHYEHNAAVDLDTTEFYAAGKPEHVVEFLAAVCAALGNLPLERIEKEAGVLAAEGGQVAHPTAAVLLNRRFGANGPGLALWEGPGYDRLTAEHVTSHVTKFFTRANAVLTLTGPPPEGLRLPLPDGERPVRGAPAVVSGSGASWAAEPSPAAGLSLLGPARDPSAVLAMDVLRERLMETARREHGISYDVDGTHVDHDTTRAERLIWLDAREGQEAQAATILWRTVNDLAASGPTTEELAFAVDGWRHMFDDPRAAFGELENAAYARLFGFRYRPMAELLAGAEQVLPAQVAATVTESLKTALLTVPEDVELDLGLPLGGCPRKDTAPAGREFRPPRLARLVNKQARAARLVLTGNAVAIVDGDGDVHQVEFGDVVGVRSDEDGRILFGRHGCVVPVLRSLFGNVDPVVEAVDRNVPGELHYAPSELATND